MKTKFPYCFLFIFILAVGTLCYGQNDTQSYRLNNIMIDGNTAQMSDSISCCDTVSFKSPKEILDSLPAPEINPFEANMLFAPKVFMGYRQIHPTFSLPNMVSMEGWRIRNAEEWTNDSIMAADSLEDTLDIGNVETATEPEIEKISLEDNSKWLINLIKKQRAQGDMHYLYMIENPEKIEYAIWDLPNPPVLFNEEMTYARFLKNQEIPEVLATDPGLITIEVPKKYWLHKFNTGLQFSQAFISPNWYQGGNDYLSLLFNFNWNVELNQAFHPNLLFQSALQYKLALSSTPKGSIRKYQISDDAFQYNLNAGLKAVGNWYYSFNLLFKTQLFNNYEENSWQRTASFLSPGDLNAGIGMSYSRTNKLKTFQYTLTISPLSYNLKTCIASNDILPHAQFNIDPNKKVKNEIGSNAEFNMSWSLTTNISYKTRLFLFSDYHYFLSDWQNTFSFDINRFLSTQLFLHLRWDTSAESNATWKKFMMREILSFGLTYTFATKS